MTSPRTSPAVSPDPPTPSCATRRRSRRVRGLALAGVLLLVAGLGCLGYVGWQLWGTDIGSEQAFRQETGQLHRTWQRPTGHTDGTAIGDAVPGSAIALLRVPRFGSGYEVPIMEGTDQQVLARGVGHYAGTAAPGQVGNFAIAGHRITHGEPFARLLELRPGDQIVVETRTAVYTYTLDTAPAALTVPDTASWVLDPVPAHPHQPPSKRLITLTTCQDLFHSPDRSIGFGHLTRTRSK